MRLVADELPSVDNQFQQVDGVLAVQRGVEIMLLLGLAEFLQQIRFAPPIAGPRDLSCPHGSDAGLRRRFLGPGFAQMAK